MQNTPPGDPAGNGGRDEQAPPGGLQRARQIRDIFREHNESLIQFLRTRLHSQEAAKEVAQEAYVKLLGLDDPSVPSFIHEVLFRTAAKIAAARAKVAAAERVAFFNDPTQHPLPERAELNLGPYLSSVNEALERLPPRCRRAFILVRYEGMEYGQAASELNLSEKKVRKFVIRAFANCTKAINEARQAAESRNSAPAKPGVALRIVHSSGQLPGS